MPTRPRLNVRAMGQDPERYTDGKLKISPESDSEDDDEDDDEDEQMPKES